MQSERYVLWLLSIFIFVLLAGNVFAQEEEEEEVIGEKPILQVSELIPEFTFDGIFNLDEWNAGTDSIGEQTEFRGKMLVLYYAVVWFTGYSSFHNFIQ